MADLEAWRALVAKELAGAPFDKLVHKTPVGVAIDPLYTQRPAEAAYVRGAAERWKLCVRGDAAELEAGADEVWDGSDFDPDVISTLAYHDAGADAADELALALSRLVAALRDGRQPTTARIAVG